MLGKILVIYDEESEVKKGKKDGDEDREKEESSCPFGFKEQV